MLGLGSNLNELKARIQKAREELDGIENSGEPLPEVINMTNMLRANEHLTKTDKIKSEILLLQDEYSRRLEQLVSSLLSIQSDLQDIVKTEASLLGLTRPTAKAGKTKKTKRRTKKTSGR